MGIVSEGNVENFTLFPMSYQRSLYVHLLQSYDSKTLKMNAKFQSKFKVVDLHISHFSEKIDTLKS